VPPKSYLRPQGGVHGVVASVGRSDVHAAAGGEVTSALMWNRVAIETLTKGEGEPIKILF
jgi:hypothetical protein